MSGDIHLRIRRLAIDAGCVDGRIGDFESGLREALQRRWSSAEGATEPAQTLADRVGAAIVPRLRQALPAGERGGGDGRD